MSDTHLTWEMLEGVPPELLAQLSKASRKRLGLATERVAAKKNAAPRTEVAPKVNNGDYMSLVRWLRYKGITPMAAKNALSVGQP